jgi:hypothetical protein
MTENQKHSTSSDEIDLVELLAKTVISIKRNLKPILLGITAGIIGGLGYFLLAPKDYESQMLISSDILTESYSKILVSDLNKLIVEKNPAAISSKLQLSENQSSSLVEIEIKSSIEKSEFIKEQEKNYLTIICQSEDNTLWPNLQKGLINFFESNDFVKTRVEHRRKYITQIVEKIDKELIDLNELKARITNGQMTQSSKDNLVLFDPTTVNSKILELNKEKINLQNSLETVNSIQLVEGFTVFEKPANPRLYISLATGAGLGLVIVTLLLAFKSLGKIVSLSEEKLANS